MAQITKQYTFTTGTKADPTQVNADLDALYTQANAQDTSISTMNTQIGILSKNFLNPLTYGCKGDGIVNDTANFQNAVNDAIAKMIPLYIPPNYIFLVFSPIVINGTISIVGGNKHSSLIRAGAVMDSIFSFTTDIYNSIFERFGFDGAGKANSAIKQVSGKTVGVTQFNDLLIVSTLTDAVYLNDGYINDFLGCEIQSNSGNGITIGKGSSFQSILNIKRCKIYANGGIGILFNGPISKGNISFNSFDTNKICAIYSVYSGFHLTIANNRFESNSGTGYTFTNPAKTIKADIILNGSNVLGNFSNTYPNKATDIENNFTSGCTIHAYVISADGVRVINNYDNVGTATAVKVNAQSTSSPLNLNVQGNQSFAKQIDADDITNNIAQAFSRYSIEVVTSRRNFITNNFLEYTVLGVNNGGTLVKGDLSYDGFDTFLISGAASGYSSLWGLTIDLAKYPELAGQLVYVAVMTKCSLGTGVAGPVVYIGASGNSRNYLASNTNWNLEEMQAILPASGTVNIGFQTLGNVNAGEKIYFANPVLSIAGTPYRDFYKDVVPPIYKADAVPTTGTWEVGKRIAKLTPTVGQPKAWVCTTTPATFTSEGNL